MASQCDHKSVGMLVWRDDKLLLIERKIIPFGFAPPAGHIDEDDSFENAAKRELEEEVGLEAKNIKLIAEGRKENACSREDGTWHYWKIYNVNANANGKVIPSQSEVKKIKWCNKDDLLGFAFKTKQYLEGKVKENDWQKSPGLETVWYQWFKKLKII